jgi:hypothetical protein
MKKWQSQIPTIPKVKNRIQCFVTTIDLFPGPYSRVIWLSNKQYLLFSIRYPNELAVKILESDALQHFREKLSDHTYNNILEPHEQ